MTERIRNDTIKNITEYKVMETRGKKRLIWYGHDRRMAFGTSGRIGSGWQKAKRKGENACNYTSRMVL